MTDHSGNESLNRHLPAEDAGLTKSVLLLGYGNVDRQDDGVAWHVLQAVAQSYGFSLPEQPDEPLVTISAGIDAAFALQLMPEEAELLSAYERVCFIDAHTGRVDQLVNLERLSPEFVNSPFTHHMTPQTCLSLVQSLYGKLPQAVLVSVRGFEFGFSQELSTATRDLVPQAAGRILDWIQAR